MKWINETDLLIEDERVVLRQIGWLGQTKQFYALKENPKPTEPGGWTPVYIQISPE